MSTSNPKNLAIGSPAAPFNLLDTRDNSMVSLQLYTGQPLFVAFICNHCPYVVHLIDVLADTAHELANSGVATVAISANDAARYPADSPEKMAALARDKGFDFPYCYDQTQSVARDYQALCTPDLYLFDSAHTLYYRGQFDSSRPGHGTATGEDLKRAAQTLLDGHPPPNNTVPSVGCSIKWLP